MSTENEDIFFKNRSTIFIRRSSWSNCLFLIGTEKIVFVLFFTDRNKRIATDREEIFSFSFSNCDREILFLFFSLQVPRKQKMLVKHEERKKFKSVLLLDEIRRKNFVRSLSSLLPFGLATIAKTLHRDDIKRRIEALLKREKRFQCHRFAPPSSLFLY